jgi:hypothetical protein
MKARHIAYMLIIAAIAVAALAGCEFLGFVSIDQRISDFQTALNTSDRSTAYESFHPDKCGDYSAIKSGTFVWSSIFDTTYSPYTLTVTDESDSSAVLVTATGSNGYATLYLRLNMQTTGVGDYRIVSMDTRPNTSSSWTVGVIQ